MPGTTVTDVFEWQRVASEAFVPLLCSADEPGFVAHLENLALSGGVSVSHVRTGPLRIERPERLARQDTGNDILMSIQLHSTGAVLQHGREASLSPGTAAIYESNRPYLLDQPDPGQELLVVRVPRGALGLPDRMVSELCGRRIDQSVPGMSAFLGYLRGLMATQNAVGVEGLAALGPLSSELLTFALRAFAQAGHSGWDSDRALLEAARQKILQELADPGLNVERLAQAANVSVRKLHAVFTAAGQTPGSEIRRLRMNKAIGLLATRPHSGQSIASIALACGFRDASTFTRAFTREFGCTPTQWVDNPT